MRTLEVRSQYLFIITKLALVREWVNGWDEEQAYMGIGGGSRCAGIQMMKTEILISVLFGYQLLLIDLNGMQGSHVHNESCSPL